jgi:carbonic anhydrase/acetyltransferase-like protein (isoleucine patch superfamily)
MNSAMTSLRPFLDKMPVVGERVYVDPACTIIGDVRIGDDASIWPGTVIRGDVNHIRIGARTNVQDGTIIHVSHDSPYNKGGYPTLIGEGVTVGHGCILHACTIGDYCLIGMGACILDGAVIEANAFIAAGAVVGPGKVVRSGELWAGNPARLMRQLSDKDIEGLRYSADHYVKVKDQYRSMPG